MLAVWVEELLEYASQALRVMRRDERYPTLMAWAREEGPALLGGGLPMAQALAPQLWSQTPLERLDFAAEPLAPPSRDEPCWCDSGRKAGQCCGRVRLPGPVPSHLMWMLSLREWRGSTLKAALASGQAPAQALLEAGLIAAETGQRGRAQQILEALFAPGDWAHLPEQAEPAFELLIDLYQERGFTRKREALLDAVLARGPLFLRGVALERLCLMHLDADDLDSARAAFVRAQQALPDSPTLAYIEAMLLLHEGHEAEAAERARFWLRRLVRQGELDPEQLQFLADLADDPAATLAEQLLSAEEELAEPLAALQALLEVLPTAPCIAVSPTPDGRRLIYHQSAREALLLAAWREHFTAEPFGDGSLGLDADPWPEAPAWLPALCAHPEWLDAPAVVGDLALALTHRFGSLPWMAPSLLVPLAERLERWLAQAAAAGDGALIWEEADNALLLRTGLALVVGMERGARQRSRQLAERLLALDEQDSLGLRELVLDQLLRDGRDAEALAASYPPAGEALGEGALGLLLGRALALYRLARRDEAAAALAEARQYNAHALALLCAAAPRSGSPVAMDDAAVVPGSRAEAWQYRALMRDQWRVTPGALEWLQAWLDGR